MPVIIYSAIWLEIEIYPFNLKEIEMQQESHCPKMSTRIDFLRFEEDKSQFKAIFCGNLFIVLFRHTMSKAAAVVQQF